MFGSPSPRLTCVAPASVSAAARVAGSSSVSDPAPKSAADAALIRSVSSGSVHE